MKKEVKILNDFSDEKDCLVGIDKMVTWLCNHGLVEDDIVSISLFALKVDEGYVFDVGLNSINVTLLKALNSYNGCTAIIECFEDLIDLNIRLKFF